MVCSNVMCMDKHENNKANAKAKTKKRKEKEFGYPVKESLEIHGEVVEN